MGGTSGGVQNFWVLLTLKPKTFGCSFGLAIRQGCRMRDRSAVRTAEVFACKVVRSVGPGSERHRTAVLSLQPHLCKRRGRFTLKLSQDSRILVHGLAQPLRMSHPPRASTRSRVLQNKFSIIGLLHPFRTPTPPHRLQHRPCNEPASKHSASLLYDGCSSFFLLLVILLLSMNGISSSGGGGSSSSSSSSRRSLLS